jgi:hypothetical protein
MQESDHDLYPSSQAGLVGVHSPEIIMPIRASCRDKPMKRNLVSYADQYNLCLIYFGKGKDNHEVIKFICKDFEIYSSRLLEEIC